MAKHTSGRRPNRWNAGSRPYAGSQDRQAKQVRIPQRTAKVRSRQLEIEVIETCDTIDHLNEGKGTGLRVLNTISPNGYNIEEGGKHFLMSEATKAKLRGQKRSRETRRIISQSIETARLNGIKIFSEATKGRTLN